MTITFMGIEVGAAYTRVDLAKKWNYKNLHAIRRGIVTPRGQNLAILFITEHGEEYHDSYDGDALVIEGEKSHRTDKRLIEIEREGGAIHLFYRTQRRSTFTYEGPMRLEYYKLNTDAPSKFFFKR